MTSPHMLDPNAIHDLSLEQRVALFTEGTRSLHRLVDEKLRPVLLAQLEKDTYEKALAATFYRMCLIVRAVVKLDEPEHFQMTAMAARSIFELLLDLQILQHDPSVADKYFDFVDVDKFRKAEKLTTFLNEHPEVDSAKHQAAIAFAVDPGRRARIEGLCQRHWGTKNSGAPRRPKHWTGIDHIAERARQAGSKYEEFYLNDYGLQSYYVHAGAAGILNLPHESFLHLFAITHASIWWLYTEATEIVASAFHLFDAMPELRDELSKAPTLGAMSASIEPLMNISNS